MNNNLMNRQESAILGSDVASVPQSDNRLQQQHVETQQNLEPTNSNIPIINFFPPSPSSQSVDPPPRQQQQLQQQQETENNNNNNNNVLALAPSSPTEGGLIFVHKVTHPNNNSITGIDGTSSPHNNSSDKSTNSNSIATGATTPLKRLNTAINVSAAFSQSKTKNNINEEEYFCLSPPENRYGGSTTTAPPHSPETDRTNLATLGLGTGSNATSCTSESEGPQGQQKLQYEQERDENSASKRNETHLRRRSKQVQADQQQSILHKLGNSNNDHGGSSSASNNIPKFHVDDNDVDDDDDDDGSNPYRYRNVHRNSNAMFNLDGGVHLNLMTSGNGVDDDDDDKDKSNNLSKSNSGNNSNENSGSLGKKSTRSTTTSNSSNSGSNKNKNDDRRPSKSNSGCFDFEKSTSPNNNHTNVPATTLFLPAALQIVNSSNSYNGDDENMNDNNNKPFVKNPSPNKSTTPSNKNDDSRENSNLDQSASGDDFMRVNSTHGNFVIRNHSSSLLRQHQQLQRQQQQNVSSSSLAPSRRVSTTTEDTAAIQQQLQMLMRNSLRHRRGSCSNNNGNNNVGSFNLGGAVGVGEVSFSNINDDNENNNNNSMFPMTRFVRTVQSPPLLGRTISHVYSPASPRSPAGHREHRLSIGGFANNNQNENTTIASTPRNSKYQRQNNKKFENGNDDDAVDGNGNNHTNMMRDLASPSSLSSTPQSVFNSEPSVREKSRLKMQKQLEREKQIQRLQENPDPVARDLAVAAVAINRIQARHFGMLPDHYDTQHSSSSSDDISSNASDDGNGGNDELQQARRLERSNKRKMLRHRLDRETLRLAILKYQEQSAARKLRRQNYHALGDYNSESDLADEEEDEETMKKDSTRRHQNIKSTSFNSQTTPFFFESWFCCKQRRTTLPDGTLDPNETCCYFPRCMRLYFYPSLFELIEENRSFIRLCAPSMMIQFLRNFISVLAFSLAGRLLDKRHLAGFVVGFSFTNIIGIAIGMGFSSVLDTLCSQAYGLHGARAVVMGIHLRTAYVFAVAYSLAYFAFSYFAGHYVIGYLKPELEASAQAFLIPSVVQVFGTTCVSATHKFLNSQHKANLAFKGYIVGSIVSVIMALGLYWAALHTPYFPDPFLNDSGGNQGNGKATTRPHTITTTTINESTTSISANSAGSHESVVVVDGQIRLIVVLCLIIGVGRLISGITMFLLGLWDKDVYFVWTGREMPSSSLPSSSNSRKNKNKTSNNLNNNNMKDNTLVDSDNKVQDYNDSDAKQQNGQIDLKRNTSCMGETNQNNNNNNNDDDEEQQLIGNNVAESNNNNDYDYNVDYLAEEGQEMKTIKSIRSQKNNVVVGSSEPVEEKQPFIISVADDHQLSDIEMVDSSDDDDVSKKHRRSREKSCNTSKKTSPLHPRSNNNYPTKTNDTIMFVPQNNQLVEEDGRGVASITTTQNVQNEQQQQQQKTSNAITINAKSNIPNRTQDDDDGDHADANDDGGVYPTSSPCSLWLHAVELHNIQEFLHLAGSCILSSCADRWVMEILAMCLTTSAYDDATIDLWGILTTIWVFWCPPSVGCYVAAAALVGNAIGAGKPGRARYLAWRILSWGLVLCAIPNLVYVFFAGSVAKIFTADPNLQIEVRHFALLFAVCSFLDGIQFVFQGVYRAVGMVKFASTVGTAVQIFLCLPISVFLVLYFKWGIVACGVCLAISNFLICLVLYVGLTGIEKARWASICEAKNPRFRIMNQNRLASAEDPDPLISPTMKPGFLSPMSPGISPSVVLHRQLENSVANRCKDNSNDDDCRKSSSRPQNQLHSNNNNNQRGSQQNMRPRHETQQGETSDMRNWNSKYNNSNALVDVTGAMQALSRAGSLRNFADDALSNSYNNNNVHHESSGIIRILPIDDYEEKQKCTNNNINDNHHHGKAKHRQQKAMSNNPNDNSKNNNNNNTVDNNNSNSPRHVASFSANDDDDNNYSSTSNANARNESSTTSGGPSPRNPAALTNSRFLSQQQQQQQQIARRVLSGDLRLFNEIDRYECERSQWGMDSPEPFDFGEVAQMYLEQQQKLRDQQQQQEQKQDEKK